MLAPEPEFTSLLFPFLAQAERGVEVTDVPLAELADRIDDSIDVVAVSAVQSTTGELADFDAIEQAAKRPRRADGDRRDPRDRLAAAGRVPLRRVACAAYKWLMSPRGTAFMVVKDELAASDEPRSGRAGTRRRTR